MKIFASSVSNLIKTRGVAAAQKNNILTPDICGLVKTDCY